MCLGDHALRWREHRAREKKAHGRMECTIMAMVTYNGRGTVIRQMDSRKSDSRECANTGLLSSLRDVGGTERLERVSRADEP